VPNIPVIVIFSSGVVLVGSGTLIMLFLYKKKKKRKENLQIDQEIQSSGIPLSQNHRNIEKLENPQTDPHSDMNLLYFERFESLKKTMTPENYESIREQLIELMDKIHSDIQSEHIDKNLQTNITALLQYIAENYDETG
jgi:hypothetical protein